MRSVLIIIYSPSFDNGQPRSRAPTVSLKTAKAQKVQVSNADAGGGAEVGLNP